MTATPPVVYGASYSVYVRAVRLTLEEKGVAYDLVPVDVFAPGGPPPEHLARHPFGRIPAFAHDGFALYESSAIERYVDEAFTGPPLQPPDARGRARMNQILAILDSYGYRTLVWDIFVERVRLPARGQTPDERKIAAALPRAAACLGALAELAAGAEWLAGDTLTLADLHAAPMFAYLRAAPEGRALVEAQASLAAWWERMAARPSMALTAPSFA